MHLNQVVDILKSAIDSSVSQSSDRPWQSAVKQLGLVSRGETGRGIIDETFAGTFDGCEVTLQHYWRDKSRTFSIQPDRTTLTLRVLSSDREIVAHTGSFDT